jgi:hypothetical protein
VWLYHTNIIFLKLIQIDANIIPAEKTVLRQEFTKNNKFTLQGIGGFPLWR